MNSRLAPLLLVLTGISTSIPQAKADIINLVYSMSGTINGTPVAYTFSGFGDSAQGRYEGVGSFSAQPPSWSLFSSIITNSGSSFEIFALPVDNGFGRGTNLLELTSGNFELSRTTDFVNTLTGLPFGSMSFVGGSTRTAVDLITITGTFNASGDWSGLSDISTVLPFNTHWQPGIGGLIDVSGTIPYITSTGVRVDAEMHSTYTVPANLGFAQVSTHAFQINALDPLTFNISYSGQVAAVPEPSTTCLLCLALSLILYIARYRLHS